MQHLVKFVRKIHLGNNYIHEDMNLHKHPQFIYYTVYIYLYYYNIWKYLE